VLIAQHIGAYWSYTLQHLRIHQARLDTTLANRGVRFSAGICKYCVYARTLRAVNTVSHKHGYVIRMARRARLFPLTIEVGPIATDGCDVTVHQQPHSAKSMKYLTALLIPSVWSTRVLLVVNSLAANFAVGPNTRARPTCSPTIIEFLRYIFAPPVRVRRCSEKSILVGIVELFVAISSNMKSDN